MKALTLIVVFSLLALAALLGAAVDGDAIVWGS